MLTASPTRKPLPEAGIHIQAHESLAGVDSAADLERAAVRTRHAVERLDEAQAGAHGSLGVVFVHSRHAEHADHGVADELLDGAAVSLDHTARSSVVLPQDGVDVLRIGALAHRGEGDEIAEEGGDDLALLGGSP